MILTEPYTLAIILFISLILLEMGSYIGKEWGADAKTRRIEDLERQVEALKEINREQRAEINNIVSALRTGDKPIDQKNNDLNVSISTAHIKSIVDEMIANEEVNIKFIPDFVERRIYEKVFRILLNVIQEISSTTKLELLGHEIELQFKRSNDLIDIDRSRLSKKSGVSGYSGSTESTSDTKKSTK